MHRSSDLLYTQTLVTNMHLLLLGWKRSEEFLIQVFVIFSGRFVRFVFILLFRSLVRKMQLDDGKSKDNVNYMFQRETTESLDSLMMNGRGCPIERPSDLIHF